MDSLTSVELSQRLTAVFGVKISPGMLVDFTVGALIAHLLKNYKEETDTAPAHNTLPPMAPLPTTASKSYCNCWRWAWRPKLFERITQIN